MKSILSLALGAVVFCLGLAAVYGQERSFDPSQFRQRMLDHIREAMNVTNDEEWTVISAKVSAVMDARRELMMQQMGSGPGPGGFGGPGGPMGPGGPGDRGPGGPPPDAGGPPGGGGGFRPQPSAEKTDLQKAIDAKASGAELKTKLARLHDAIQAKKAKLEAAREELRQLLTTRQEAVAVVEGLLE